MAQRKCSECGHWNTDLDYCEKCGHLINLELQVQVEQKKKWAEKATKEPDKLDVIVDYFRYSKWWIFRAIYAVFHAVWVMVVAIISFFIYLMAWGPG
jgi:uncharacterized membrane protein YvbJ